jgi:hypothetical protein
MTGRVRAASTAAGGSLRAAGDRLMTLLLVRRGARHHCPQCAVEFAPALTDQRCPICGWAVPDVPLKPVRQRTRALAGVGAAWFLGAVIFALLAHALYS